MSLSLDDKLTSNDKLISNDISSSLDVSLSLDGSAIYVWNITDILTVLHDSSSTRDYKQVQYLK